MKWRDWYIIVIGVMLSLLWTPVYFIFFCEFPYYVDGYSNCFRDPVHFARPLKIATTTVDLTRYVLNNTVYRYVGAYSALAGWDYYLVYNDPGYAGQHPRQTPPIPCIVEKVNIYFPKIRKKIGVGDRVLGIALLGNRTVPWGIWWNTTPAPPWGYSGPSVYFGSLKIDFWDWGFYFTTPHIPLVVGDRAYFIYWYSLWCSDGEKKLWEVRVFSPPRLYEKQILPGYTLVFWNREPVDCPLHVVFDGKCLVCFDGYNITAVDPVEGRAVWRVDVGIRTTKLEKGYYKRYVGGTLVEEWEFNYTRPIILGFPAGAASSNGKQLTVLVTVNTTLVVDTKAMRVYNISPPVLPGKELYFYPWTLEIPVVGDTAFVLATSKPYKYPPEFFPWPEREKVELYLVRLDLREKKASVAVKIYEGYWYPSVARVFYSGNRILVCFWVKEGTYIISYDMLLPWLLTFHSLVKGIWFTNIRVVWSGLLIVGYHYPESDWSMMWTGTRALLVLDLLPDAFLPPLFPLLVFIGIYIVVKLRERRKKSAFFSSLHV